jgi:hypothetical protein
MKNKSSTISRSGAKWLPGAMALAATAASTQAATVQITLLGNKVSSSGGNQLNADLTGDGVVDITSLIGRVTDSSGFHGAELQSPVVGAAAVWFDIQGYRARATATVPNNVQWSPNPMLAEVLAPVVFTDARINGGGATSGWLEVRAFNTSQVEHTVALTRLIFDDASTTRPAFGSIPGVQSEWAPGAIPEPSSFALLSLGAAGLLARRRRQAA